MIFKEQEGYFGNFLAHFTFADIDSFRDLFDIGYHWALLWTLNGMI